MTSFEIRLRLSQLPAETLLSSAHVAALADTLLPIPKPESLAGRRITEADLANLLGEPESTLQGWHAAGQGSRIRYRAGDIREWLERRAVPHGLPADADQFEEDGETYEWGEPVPAIIVDGRMTGVFAKLDEEVEPDGYEILRIASPVVAAYSPTNLTRTQFNDLLKVVDALGTFGQEMSTSPDNAAATFDQWQDKASPDARLLFLRIALGHATGIASDVLTTIPAERQQRINPAEWLYRLWLDHSFCALDMGGLQAMLDQQTAALNRNAMVAKSDGVIVFHGTIAHLLADTTGAFFNLKSPVECDGPSCHQSYTQLLLRLLRNGMRTDRPNRDKQTAETIGEQIYADNPESGWFCYLVPKYGLNDKLETELPVKSGGVDTTITKV
ncbi:helix-turn-helix domain-containing protein [Paraburkholderia fungorum]|uniref:helix-turn-helix domain-containing protein n=1 Tax=Paraburkholderia fungorum TaxID=134537 RepID=UPI0038BC19BF